MSSDVNNILEETLQYNSTSADSSTVLSSDDISKMLSLEQLEGLRQDRSERKAFASKAFWMMCVYLFIVFVLITLTGCNKLCFDTTIIVTILTTTTVDIIGLFVFVMRYLFSK